MKAVIVGAGATTRELIRRLGDSWDVVVIDTDPAMLAAVELIRDITAILGDGSSSVVLRNAGIDSASTVVAGSGSDDVNLEVVSLAKDAGAEHIVAISRQPERSDEYRALGVDVVVPSLLAARDIEIDMEPRKLASTTFSGGRAEAIEFEITPDSPVQGKALREIHSELWVVAAILRDGQLVVPHGVTRLLTGDRVTIVGSAADFSQIVRTFASGVSKFPLNFGRKVIVALNSQADFDGPVAEAAHFVRNSNAASILLVQTRLEAIKSAASAAELEGLLALATSETLGVEVERREVEGNPYRARRDIATEESVGVIVAGMRPNSFIRTYAGIPKLLNELGPAGVPILLTNGDTGFDAIIAPVRRTVSGDSAGRAAIDIARTSGAKVIGVAVANPTFMGRDDLMEMRDATSWLRREASVQDVVVERHVVRGNPVRVISDVVKRDRLLVVSSPVGRVSRWRPGIAVWAAAMGDGSALFVPAVD